jgi:hypothetical protein
LEEKFIDSLVTNKNDGICRELLLHSLSNMREYSLIITILIVYSTTLTKARALSYLARKVIRLGKEANAGSSSATKRLKGILTT